MQMWQEIGPKMVAGKVLSYDDTYQLMDRVMTDQLGEIRLASYLSLLQARGVTVSELQALADSMRDHAVKIDLPTAALDIVGTGGDQAGTANFSSMAAIIAAACGVPVVKHGNRSATSACGAADALEALGVKIDLSTERIEQIFRETGMAFLFANKFHPSMKYAAPVRRELSFRTVFNLLGPLSNPARVQAMTVGVSQSSSAPLVAGVFAQRSNSALVFRGNDYGLDELTNVEPATIWWVKDGQVECSEIDFCSELGLPSVQLSELQGGDPSYNAKLIWQMASGENRAMTTVACLNAAAGLISAEPVVETIDLGAKSTLAEKFGRAFTLAERAIRDGRVKALLERWIALSK